LTDNSDPLIVFDAVGTLIRPIRSISETYFDFGKRFGSKLTRTEIGKRFRHARDVYFVGCDGDQQKSSEAIERNRWYQLVSDVFIDVGEANSLFLELWDFFANANAWRLYEDVSICLEKLARRKLRWLIASNFDGRLLSICHQFSQFADAFDVMVSSTIGFRKPDRRFFEAIEGRTGLGGDQLLKVGDRAEHDFEGARNAGWSALLLNRRSTESGLFTISSLDELPIRVDEIFG